MSTPLDKFITRLRQDNPFDSNRVDRPSPGDVDVEAVHDAEFRKIEARACQALLQKRGIGVVLWGEAGLGKSHLLSRLWRWADRGDRALFLYLHNLQARAERLPRYVLKCVISMLTQGRTRQFRGTPLYALVKAFVKAALNQQGQAQLAYGDVDRAYQWQVDRLIAEDRTRVHLIDRTVFNVLFRFYASANCAYHTGEDDGLARLAVRWLSGDSLDYDQAFKLSLHAAGDLGEPVQLEDDERVKLVLIALTEMALVRQQPFLICFDQQIDNSTPEQVGALSKFLHELLDSARNLLVVTAGSQQVMLRFSGDGTISHPAWDRIAQYRFDLSLIRREEGRAILKARLDAFLQPFLDNETVRGRLERDALFPLGTGWFDDRLRDKIDFRPRELINWARERWEQQQHALANAARVDDWLHTWDELDQAAPAAGLHDLDAAIDERVEKELAKQKALRLQSLATLPPSGDNLAGLVRALLGQCVNRSTPDSLLHVLHPQTVNARRLPPYDLMVWQRQLRTNMEISTGLLFLVNGNATATTGFLRRIVQDRQAPDRVVLVTEERQPLALGRDKNAHGRKHLKALLSRGDDRFQLVVLTIAEYADLDALLEVVGQARAGDLTIDLPNGAMRPLRDEEVIDSHHRRRRYAAHPLLKRIFLPPDKGPSSSKTELPPAAKSKQLSPLGNGTKGG